VEKKISDIMSSARINAYRAESVAQGYSMQKALGLINNPVKENSVVNHLSDDLCRLLVLC
jgi:hypothetical protein